MELAQVENQNTENQTTVNQHAESQQFEASPRPVLSEVKFQDKSIFVLRDDLLPGGTKQRAAIPYIAKLMASGVEHFVYASPFSGFAQVALAFACSQLGARCSLFCERDNHGHLHEFSKLAQSYGAKVHLCDDLGTATEAAERHRSPQSEPMMVIPLGFNDPTFKFFLEKEIRMIWRELTASHQVKELWLPVGSGTLLSTARQVVEPRVRIYGVNVNVLPESDQRISAIIQDPEVNYVKCQQRFHEPCRETVPVPSNLYYDAKLFAHLQTSATDGAFWWNVAR